MTEQPVGTTASAADIYAAELNSASVEIQTLLKLLLDLDSSTGNIVHEIEKVNKIDAQLLTGYSVPYSGMSIIFYVAQRLCRKSALSPVTASEEAITLFKLLMDLGTKPDSLDGVMRQNVMYYAAKAGSLECCELLASRGMVANMTDIHNQTPLFYAAKEGHMPVVEWLVRSANCSVNHIDNNGQTALFYASREDRVDCVVKMVNELGADPLIRDIYKKRARGYLKTLTQKQMSDFLTEVERARDPCMHASHRRLFIVRNEPVGAAAMTLRQHKPYNPHREEDEQEMTAPAAPASVPAKRQRSSASGTTTPAGPLSRSRSDMSTSSKNEKTEKVERSEKPTRRTSAAASPAPSPVYSEPANVSGRSRFRIRAPLGNGGLETFENSFPEFALWRTTSAPATGTEKPGTIQASPPRQLTRPARAPVAGMSPVWVPVVSLLLRGPLWRYGPATIFHKHILQLPPNLGPKYQAMDTGPEKKLSVDLSVIRKRLEKGKYTKMTEVDNDVRAMIQQAYTLAGGAETPLGLLTRATEIYYSQQLAGCGLAGVIRQEAEDLARNTRRQILEEAVKTESKQSPII